MAANLSVAQITTLRDNLVTAYTTLSTTPTTQYQLGDRMFTYLDRAKIWAEIKTLTRLLLLRDTTTNCRGYNRMDLRQWN
jgi:hypothetical protein|tara:strand:+ start:72 stop:311 length:240 start_codon:yes stop_codon:yes gene_type:complete